MIEVRSLTFGALVLAIFILFALAGTAGALAVLETRARRRLERKIEFWKCSYLEFQARAVAEKARADAANDLARRWAGAYAEADRERVDFAAAAGMWNDAYRRLSKTQNDA